MRLTISHATKYSYEDPVNYGLLELRLSPVDGPGQRVVQWSIEVEGGNKQAVFRDQHNNEVWLISMSGEGVEILITSKGIVETADVAGMQGLHRGYAPLWYFQRNTSLTQPGPSVRKLAKDVSSPGAEAIQTLHDLSSAIIERVTYVQGVTTPVHTGEQALSAGNGVCQDHSHIFIAASRLMGYPARYVSGYLMLDDRVQQDASHAWAEAHVEGLGWVGFDVSNGISPDARYVRMATGLDYSDAAPVSGLRYGDNAKESLVVDIQVAQ